LSQTRTDLVAKIGARLITLGHIMGPGEVESIVNDVQQVIVPDNATAIADCTADIVLFPADPQVLGG
jgi:hypothetical protein